ncbi:hypothetical protein BIY24_03840 [Halobacteriovorax marinus]|uniref:LysR family transcriptional regulator n=1 Tax=Halobacteriovorax marinus TaxID=97084 RepID=UPI000BC3151A|nr:LysR family transcriptional regulator [Halobacteriovorax marinus]ATH07098.1 hypothetical protein BIY24_03840 [Halobacteriovorax marinus]
MILKKNHMRLRDHIEKLNYFVACVEHGTLRKASTAIGVGQPQLTKVIKQLEDLLETQLIIRSRQGITTTKDGQLLYEEGKRILQSVDKLEFSLNQSEEELHGEITIGTYDSISRYFFPDFIKYMNSLFPKLSISLYTSRSDDLLSKLKKGKIDFAVFVGKNRSKELVSKVVYDDHFCFYQSNKLEKSFTKSLIYFPSPLEGDSMKEMTKNFETFHHCMNLETVLSLTSSGLGVGLLPTKVAQEQILSGKLKHIYPSQKFAPHSVSIAKSKKTDSTEVSIVYDEVLRFLNIWLGHYN